MEPLTTIRIPIGEFSCAECRSAPTPLREESSIPFHLMPVEVQGEAEMPPLTVDVDVRKIKWQRYRPGIYTATATVAIKCPCCQDTRRASYYLEVQYVQGSSRNRR
jgi:hypothetical protein